MTCSPHIAGLPSSHHVLRKRGVAHDAQRELVRDGPEPVVERAQCRAWQLERLVEGVGLAVSAT
jgi:hypothetical protein